MRVRNSSVVHRFAIRLPGETSSVRACRTLGGLDEPASGKGGSREYATLVPRGVLALEEFRKARDTMADEARAQSPLGFAVMAHDVDTQDFGFLLPALQDDPDNLLPERRRTRDALVELGRSMRASSSSRAC
jgi:hypothetical protein